MKTTRYAQPLLRLNVRAISPEARALVSHCLVNVILPLLPPQRPSSLAGLTLATEAIIGNLISALAEPWGDGWRRRPMSKDRFTGEPVGWTIFFKAVDAMLAAGLIEKVEAIANRTDTRFRLTEAGRKLAADYQVTQGDVGIHFT